MTTTNNPIVSGCSTADLLAVGSPLESLKMAFPVKLYTFKCVNCGRVVALAEPEFKNGVGVLVKCPCGNTIGCARVSNAEGRDGAKRSSLP